MLELDEWGIPIMEDQKDYEEKLRAVTHGKVVVVTAPDGKTLSKPFLRIQENYEGRKYKGKFVSMSRFKKWYKHHHRSTGFTYYEDWLGFNFPGKAVLEFLDLYGGHENDAEKALISKFDLGKLPGQYVIGILEGDHGTLLHEMAHALFYLDSEYQEAAVSYLQKMEHLKELEDAFAKSDYHNSVWLDEMQAYLIANIGDLDVRGKPLDDLKRFDQIVMDLKSLFAQHVSKYPEVKALI